MRRLSPWLRILVGVVIVIMAVKVLLNNAPTIRHDAAAVVDLYGLHWRLNGYTLGGLVVLMASVGLGLMALGVVTLRRRSRPA